jgi:hypothetical protein
MMMTNLLTNLRKVTASKNVAEKLGPYKARAFNSATNSY